jgi:cytidylate kinase
MNNHKIIIAIDGHSSSGKSSFARAIAMRMGYVYVDTGAMYRAVTLFALRCGMINDGKVNISMINAALPMMNITFTHNSALGKSETYLCGENVEREIRLMEVSANVSRISAIAEVRQALVQQQQMMGVDKGIVMDGRDIGTVVFPDAEVKIFLTATVAVRARRRYDELVGRGEDADYAAIEHNIRQRDYIDEHRAVAPLRPAADAIFLDNSNMSPQEQMEWVMDKINAVLAAQDKKSMT